MTVDRVGSKMWPLRRDCVLKNRIERNDESAGKIPGF